MYWNKQTRNKPEAKKRGFYILIILWFSFLPRIAAIQWNPASTQVLQKCARQPNDLPASGSNPSNTGKACLRQGTSTHLGFADANPLYLESSPWSWAELALRGRWGALCSQVCVPWPGCPHGGQWSDTAGSTLTLWRAGHSTRAASPNFRSSAWLWASWERQRAKPSKAALQQGLAFPFSSSHRDATGTRLTAAQPREPL